MNILAKLSTVLTMFMPFKKCVMINFITFALQITKKLWEKLSLWRIKKGV
jgi:hypothetical protein